MKKSIILSLSLMLGTGLSAQQFNGTAELTKSNDSELKRNHKQIAPQLKAKSSAIIWSEDFGGGIPSTWTNVCTDSVGNLLNGSWEYRGPNTTPNNGIGSRGAFGNDTIVVNSATRANGFVLFDSDYLDNGGTAGGTGTAQAPHTGILTTDTIDLTGHPFVEIQVTSYYRKYASSFLIATSIDGGATFTDTVEILADLALNAASARNEVRTAKLPGIGGEDEVVLQFIFDGTLEGAPGAFGYYVLQIDDIIIQDLPPYKTAFVESGGAPANDFISDGNKNGHVPLDQAKPIVFDSNIQNVGADTITNVRLRVDILDASGAVVDSVFSPAAASILPDSVVDYNTFTTTAWTPTAIGDYTLRYMIDMDEMPSSGVETTAEFGFVVGSEGNGVGALMAKSSMDHGSLDNVVGNANIGDDDGSAIMSLVSFPNPSPGKSTVSIYGLETYFSTRTVAGGDIEIQLYDTTGFDPSNGFSGSPLINRSFTVPATWVGQLVTIDLTNNGTPVEVNPGGYHMVMYMYSNAGANDIYIANDQSFESRVYNSGLYSTSAGRWYSAFSGGRTLNQPWLRAVSDPTIGLDENNEVVSLNVYPNPSSGDVNIDIAKGGDYTIELLDMTGKIVDFNSSTFNSNEKVSLDYSALPKGVYLLNVKGEGLTKTAKVVLK